MRSQLSSWTNVLTKLGFTRVRVRTPTRMASRRILRFEQFEDRRMLATFMVTNDADAPENTPATIGTLRQAIFDANADAIPDTIVFDPAVFDTPKTITLTEGHLSITQAVTIDATIDGAGPSQELLGITINADVNSRIFHIVNSSLTGTISLTGMTLTGGNGDIYGGGAILMESTSGFSYYESTKLVLDAMTIMGNQSSSSGGGIAVMKTNDFTLEIRNSTITDNAASSNGGGVFSRAQNVLLTNATVSDNEASSGGLRNADLAMAV